jgi:peptidoglycan/xylan/chitin deacetylase (PgdA/CDA1 family)
MVRQQDYVTLLFYYLGYSSISANIFRIKRIPITRFATFHDIRPETLEIFEEKLKFLHFRTNVVSMDDFFRGRLSSRKLNTVITFDDGYKAWVTHAVHLLAKYGLPATFFVSSAFAGLSSDMEPEPTRRQSFLKRESPKYETRIDAEDLRIIDRLGFTIGGHTLSHCDLSEIKDRSIARSELSEDKIRLERIIGKNADYFAYPSGRYQNPWINLVEILREVGYKGAVTTESGANNSRSHPYLIHRELTDAAMPLRVFKARISGDYDPVRRAKRLAQELSRLLKNQRHHLQPK